MCHLLDREAEEPARRGQGISESQIPWPWIFRRNHGFPIGWAEVTGYEGIEMTSRLPRAR